jgi:hypothetical protein
MHALKQMGIDDFALARFSFSFHNWSYCICVLSFAEFALGHHDPWFVLVWFEPLGPFGFAFGSV